MAIQTLFNPSGDVSIQDDLWHIAHSTQSGGTDMKYVFDVYNGAVQLIRSKVYPNPANGRGYFNANRIVANEITYNWFRPYASNGKVWVYEPSASGECALTYTIKVGEELSGTTTANLVTANVTAFNWTPSLFQRRTDISNFYCNFLTERPKAIKASIGETILIPYRSIRPNESYVSVKLQIQYQIFKTTGTSSGTTPLLEAFTMSGKFLQLDVGSVAMNNTLPATLQNPVPIDSNTTAYNFKIIANLNDGSGEIQQIYSDVYSVFLECNRYEPVLLHFMNRFGMFETAKFGLVNKLMMENEKKSFTKQEYRYGNTSVNYKDGNNVYYEGKINYNTKSKWKYQLSMNYPSDAEYEWLEQLMTSPQIFAQLEDGYYPVTILTNTYTYNKNVWGGLKTLDIEIELNQNRNGFRR